MIKNNSKRKNYKVTVLDSHHKNYYLNDNKQYKHLKEN